ncbi:MAG: hypothetical protein JXA37_07925 [Chloroflexia bacterium]|nr:hypothetical protein [Chloroflexia bacterium]
MNLIAKPDLQALLEGSPQWAVSIYLPTYRVGREVQQNSTRFKNLLQQAENTLDERGLRDRERQEALQPAQALLRDTSFWLQQSDGLALFVAPETFLYYRLPLDFEELAIVGQRFHLKPLLSMFGEGGRFYVLALSQSEVRLLQGTRYSVDVVDLENVPGSLDVALRFDDPESQLQYHTGTTDQRGRRPAAFHGHGVGGKEAQHKSNIKRFFDQVDAGLQDILSPEISLSQGAPLVLAGVDFLQDIYREANSYPHLLDRGISGNPDETSAAELHQRSWELLGPYFQQAQQEAENQYWDLSNTPLTSTALSEIVPAAHEGRVETLFVALGKQRWGHFDRQAYQVQLHRQKQAGDVDLLDEAALLTLLQGGVVYALEPEQVPGGEALAAVFRYSAPTRPSI